MDKVLRNKLLSVLFILIAFVVLYFALWANNDTITWVGLGVMGLAAVNLYINS